jgi:hypothetical protein
MIRKATICILILSILVCGCSTIVSEKRGTIQVTASPSGAEVYLDNGYRGTTPTTINDISVGNHTIELRYREYQIWSTIIIVSAGSTSYISTTLNPISPTSIIPTTQITQITAQSPLITTSPISIPTPSMTTTTVQPPSQLTSNDINTHFMDLAFGSGTTYLNRFVYPPNSPSQKNTISPFNGENGDMQLIKQFISDFNELSHTNQFSDLRRDIEDNSHADIVIKFISKDGMSGIAKEAYKKEIKVNGVPYAKIGNGTIYINSDLKGDARNHSILRGIYYELGFNGETATYPDSIFYYQDNTNTQLSYIDKKAIEIMYGTGLYRNMIVDDVKKLILIK